MIAWPVSDLLPHAGAAILIDGAVFRRRTPERASHGPSGWAVQRARRRPTILGRNRDHGSGCGGLGRLPGAHARPPRRARLPTGYPALCLRMDIVSTGSASARRRERSLHAESGIGLFECHLRHAGTRLAARLTVYQPPDAAAFLPIPRPIRRKRHRFDAMDTTTILITGSSRGIDTQSRAGRARRTRYRDPLPQSTRAGGIRGARRRRPGTPGPDPAIRRRPA